MSQHPPPPPSFPPPPAGPPSAGPPPAGPPAWGPPPSGPPGFPPPSGDKGKGLWIVLGVVGVVLLIGIAIGLVVALTGDDDSDGDGDRGADSAAATPEDVVERLVAAAEDGDCAAAEKLLTEDARASDPCESEDFRLLATEDVESDVHDASIDGSTASVPADFTSQAGSSTYTFVLEKVDGEWLVASYDVARSASSEGPSVTAPTDGPSPSGSPSAGGSSTAGAVPDEPTAVVEAFLDSAFAGDCATAEDLVTSAYLADEGSCDAAEIPTELGDSVKWDVGDATVDAAAGTATVPVEITIYGSSQKSDFELVREGGRWKISDAG